MRKTINLNNAKGFIVLITIVIVLWLLSILTLFLIFDNMEARGQFGDMFGAVNALFSGAAFAGVIYAIILQKQELGLQRKELKMTRAELRRAAEAQEKSEKALTKQADSLRLTAKLNGLNSMLNHYDMLDDRFQDVYHYTSHKPETDRLIKEIKKIVDKK